MPPPVSLLAADEPAPLEIVNPAAASPWLLVCEHAGNRIPRALGTLGLDHDERHRHIAWDIGAAQVARGLAAALDAVLFVQPYSRLVIDGNRPRHVPSLVPASSDGTVITANVDLDPEQVQQRWEQIHQPFHQAIEADLQRRPQRALLAVHSFTPALRSNPQPRPMHLGLLHGSDRRLADALHQGLQTVAPDLRAEFNQPYAVDDVSDYAIPVHGLSRGIPNLLLEIRNDLIDTAQGQAHMVGLLADALAQPPARQLLSSLVQDAS